MRFIMPSRSRRLSGSRGSQASALARRSRIGEPDSGGARLKRSGPNSNGTLSLKRHDAVLNAAQGRAEANPLLTCVIKPLSGPPPSLSERGIVTDHEGKSESLQEAVAKGKWPSHFSKTAKDGTAAFRSSYRIRRENPNCEGTFIQVGPCRQVGGP